MDMNGSLELMFTLSSYESSCAKKQGNLYFSRMLLNSCMTGKGVLITAFLESSDFKLIQVRI